MALKMRQSLAEFEEVFREEMLEDHHRSERLRRAAVARSRKRHRERQEKRGTLRFWMLVLTLILTAVGVTIGMFEALYALLG